LSRRPTFVLFVSFVVKDLDKINRPSRLRRAIWFDFFICPLTRLRPTIRPIVIIVIIIVIGETKIVYHDGGIIAQSYVSSLENPPLDPGRS